LGVKSLELPAKAFVVCTCNGRTYKNLLQYQEHCFNDSEYLDTEQTLECVPCGRLFAAKKDCFNHLKSSPSHNGNVKFAKALLDLSRTNVADTDLSLSRAARSELMLFELTKYLIVCHTSSPAGFWRFKPHLIKFGPVGPLDQIRVHLIK
jgi:uncharacterized C2H2 Zn-finger protein